MQVLTDSKDISLFRLITLKGALKLEVLGMKRRGRSVYAIVKSELGFRGDKKAVLAQLETHIKTLKENPNGTTTES